MERAATQEDQRAERITSWAALPGPPIASQDIVEEVLDYSADRGHHRDDLAGAIHRVTTS